MSRLIDADELKKDNDVVVWLSRDTVRAGKMIKAFSELFIKKINDTPTVNAIVIPEGATNGDMIMALFPNASVYEQNGGSTYSVNNEYNFNATWWDTPYKEGE